MKAYGYGYGTPFVKANRELNPANIPNLAAWYKGDAGLTLVGGEVDVWADQSGNGRNISAPAAINRPTITTRNGKNVLVFNGSSKALQNLATTLFRNVSGGTIIIAGLCTDTSVPRQQLVINTPTNTARALIGYRPTYGTRLGAAAAGRRENTDTISAEVGQLTLNTAWLNNSARFNYASAILQTYVNNVATDSLNPFQTAGNTPANGGALSVGANAALAAGWFIGQIGEILIYERALTDAELTQIQTYLSSRW